MSGGDNLFQLPLYKIIRYLRRDEYPTFHFEHIQTTLTCLFVTLHGSRPKPLICPHEPVQNSSEVCREKEKC